MTNRISRSCTFTLIPLLSLLTFATHAGAQQNTDYIVYNFCSNGGGENLCLDGQNPSAGVIQDAAGNLYGTTAYGGANNLNIGNVADGGGTLFKLDTQGNETVLYSFCSASHCTDGAIPSSGLIEDAAGNLYGATAYGGAHTLYGGHGYGVVFKVNSKTGQETVLHSFCSELNCADGASPSSVIQDAAGNLYGTTVSGGGNPIPNCPARGSLASSCGTVFKLDTNASETVLYNFCSASNCADGAYPDSGVIQDAAGKLYGTTAGGGAYDGGTVFELEPPAQPGGAWTENVLYSFCSAANCADGANPSGVIEDAAGKLYGTSANGGAYSNGTAFELAPPAQPGGHWAENVLYSFCAKGGSNCSDGAVPNGGLIRDAVGKLYGTTSYGGAQLGPCQGGGCGTVFKLAPGPEGAWHESVLYIFCLDTICDDGAYPNGALIQDGAGNLYGTTGWGGNYGDCFVIVDCLSGVMFALPTGKNTYFSASVALTSSPNHSEIDQPVTFSALVTGLIGATPTGSVTFETSKTDLGTVTLVDGQASFTTTFTKAGRFSIRASYSGDIGYNAAKSKPLVQVVEK